MSLTSYLQDRQLTVVLAGEIDHHTARQIMQTLAAKVDHYLPIQCILDYKDVTFMDSSGVAIVIFMLRRMRELGGDVTVRDPAPCVDRMLRLTGFDRRVKIELSTAGIRTTHGKR